MTDVLDEIRAAAGRVDETTRDKLMNAAIDAFAAKGFHGTTTRDIALRAGLSSAGVYVHYKSKEDLLHVIALTGHKKVLDLVTRVAAGAERPGPQLRQVMYAFTLWHALHHTRARVVQYELSALSRGHYRTLARIRRLTEEQMRVIVQAGVDAGAFSTPDPHMTTRALLSLGIDVARWYRDDGGWSAEDVAAHYTDLALRMVGARGSRATKRS